MEDNGKTAPEPIPAGDYITEAARVSELGKEYSSRNRHMVLRITQGEFAGRELFCPLHILFPKDIEITVEHVEASEDTFFIRVTPKKEHV